MDTEPPRPVSVWPFDNSPPPDETSIREPACNVTPFEPAMVTRPPFA